MVAVPHFGEQLVDLGLFKLYSVELFVLLLHLGWAFDCSESGTTNDLLEWTRIGMDTDLLEFGLDVVTFLLIQFGLLIGDQLPHLEDLRHAGLRRLVLVRHLAGIDHWPYVGI